MKRIFAVSFVILTAISTTFAQRVGYVDTKYIMDKIPEYKAAQDEVDRLSGKWQRELEDRYKAIERMYSEYQAGEVLMPEDMKREKQDEIFEAEREAKEYREKKFGYDGELFDLQESKVKPIQDKVFKAVENVAKQKRYDYVFDKAGEVLWLYTNAIYDLSDLVLEDLGFSTNNSSNSNQRQ